MFEFGLGMVPVVVLGFGLAFSYGHLRGRRYHDRL